MDIFWKKPDWEESDRHLSQLKATPFQRPFPKMKISPGIALVQGPRQIGKSSWLKTLLSERVKAKKEVFYYSCEDIQDHQTLTELLKSQIQAEVFFLDEISFVDEWWRSIKKLADIHHKKSFILTGSNSYDLKKGMDLMPGRWMQGGGEFFLLPMDFFEWQSMRKKAGWAELGRDEAFEQYFRIGGFPTALIEAGEEGKKPVQAIQTYRRWLMGDLLKLKKQEIYMRELLGQLAKILTTPVSLQGLAQKTQMMSYHTAQDYISVLEHCFAVKTLFAYNPETEVFQFKKEKKFYFTDPLIYWVAMDWAGMKPPENSDEKIAEQVAHEFLSRQTKRLGYFSNQQGEIDFIHERSWVVEIKWSNIVNNLSKAYKNIQVGQKTVWSKNNFLGNLGGGAI
jgi:predicted AAA+ superfamily ATPase